MQIDDVYIVQWYMEEDDLWVDMSEELPDEDAAWVWVNESGYSASTYRVINVCSDKRSRGDNDE